ncbi:hypothetical protein JHK87_042940 [Glycine soja]|nr:hypothetical protein JHK87_042940 [Glycine soja]
MSPFTLQDFKAKGHFGVVAARLGKLKLDPPAVSSPRKAGFFTMKLLGGPSEPEASLGDLGEAGKLKLRKNSWGSNTYEFDEVLIEFASQKRVYEVIVKPASVLDGYNGIVMAYGQTRIGKTFTLGQLGEEDTSDRGIMVCSMEDILADISLGIDFVTVSYLQLYIEALQDFLNPANDNIPIVEDPKTGDVSLSGDTSVEIKDQPSFLELLRVGETHRIAANTKLNTESSHSHAILTVHVKRFVVDCEDVVSTKNNDASHLTKPSKPIFRKSKLVVVDLARSEHIHKSSIY